MPGMPIGEMAALGKTAGWRKLFGSVGEDLGAFIPGKIGAEPMYQGSKMSSRGFSGIENRNPLMPDFAADGPHVTQGEHGASGLNPRVRKVTIPGNDAKAAQEALRAEHVDNSTLGKLRRLLSTRPGMVGAGIAGGAGAGMLMSGDSDQQIDPQLLAMLQQRQTGGY